jgi:glycosyltransferase involved in cell wall biosynthesis
MKIILITPGTGSYYCGVCMRDNALAKELIRMGHDAVMLPMYLPLTLDEPAASPDAPIFYGGIRVYLQQRFAFFRHSPRWLDKLLNNSSLLRMAGRQTGLTDGGQLGELTLSMIRGEEGRQAKELDELMEWLKNHGKPDAVWLSTALLIGLARRIKTELRVPVLASLQGEDGFADSLPEPWRERTWQTLAERARDVDLFIAPSRFYADFMAARLQLPTPQLRVIPNGICLEGYEGERRPSEPPVIGYLARFIEGKGLGLVVDAFIELKAKGGFPEVRLVCAGAMTTEDEQYVRALKRKLADAGLSRDVEFRPNVTREEKIAFLQGLTLFSVPTVYPEAFGLFLIEALAAGVPVVQPRRAAFPEVIEATGGGVLFESGRAGALADAWELLLMNPAKARELGAHGRAVVQREYSMTRMAERFLDVTREIFDGARTAQ